MINFSFVCVFKLVFHFNINHLLLIRHNLIKNIIGVYY